MTLEELLALPQPAMAPADKQEFLRQGLEELVAWHRARCPAYARILSRLYPGWDGAKDLAELPWLPVGLFKRLELRSVPEAEVFRVMFSSGTSGQARSRVVLDRATAALQARALASSLRGLLGPQRLPMLLVEAEAEARGEGLFTARQAGVLGMLPFGRDHLFLLDPEGGLRRAALEAWLLRHGRSPFLIFGFTFMVWQQLVEAAPGLDLGQGLLVHTGGWKKLQDRAVDRTRFKARLQEACGLARVHDMYGMVEQTGSVFLEGADGLLRAADFAEALVRDPTDLAPAATGAPGLIQVLSLLPRSYPGHSLLTGDLGRIRQGPLGPGLEVLGRAPRAEPRGCSDTRVEAP